MKVPVIPKIQGFTEPEGSRYYYLIASDGAYLVKNTDIFKASVRLDPGFEAPEMLRLLPHEEHAELKTGRIPLKQVQQAVNFFKEAKSRFNCEALLFIYFNIKLKQFNLVAPRQFASIASVRSLDSATRSGDSFPIGTMHSHPGTAFHSSVDQEDEAGFDGLHITVGNLDAVVPGFSCTIWVSGRCFEKNPTDTLEYEVDVPTDWISQIQLSGRTATRPATPIADALSVMKSRLGRS